MKHTHAMRNNLIILAAVALIIIGGVYFWHRHTDDQTNQTNMQCQKICTTLDTQMDSERSCTDICTRE